MRSGLTRNSLLNLLGQGLPPAAALVAIPFLLNGLGTDRFGILTLVWITIGYLGLFDLGLGRALTQVVAERVAENEGGAAPSVVWWVLGVMFALGSITGVGVVLGTPWMVRSVLNVPPDLLRETTHSFYLLSIAIPFVVAGSGLLGILAAFHRFGVINAIRGPVGVFSLVAPLAVLPFTDSLVPVTALLVAGRAVAFLATLVACRRVLPPLSSGFGTPSDRRPLLRFGAWMSVTNIISPLMAFMDRFVIGSVMTVAAVAYYATPHDLATRLLILPTAIVTAVFPTVAELYRTDRVRTMQLFTRGTKYIAIVLFPVLLLVTAYAEEGFAWWLGEEFAAQSTTVLRVLALGAFANGITQVPYTFVQGIGRPDLSARIHLVEFLIYLPVLWWAIGSFGIVGAAVAWTGRVVLDGVLLFLLFHRAYGGEATMLVKTALGFTVAASAMWLPVFFLDPLPKAGITVATLGLFSVTVWSLVLGDDERVRVSATVGRAIRLRRP